VFIAVNVRCVLVVSVEAASHTQQTTAPRRSRFFLLALSNRNVLRADFKESTVRIFHRVRQFIPGLRSSDRKERCPKLEIGVSTTRSPRAAERSHDTTVDTGRQRSDKYDGAKPLTALNTSRHNLNWMRFGTGSQCRRSGFADSFASRH